MGPGDLLRNQAASGILIVGVIKASGSQGKARKGMRATSTGKLSRRAWLQHALETLASEGIEGLRVDRLAKGLGITRGSFYWHFKDRRDLLESLLEYWIETSTTEAFDRIRQLKGGPKARLLTLMRLIERGKLGRYDVAIRAWAENDPVAARAVRRVDEIRIEFIDELFRGMGFKGDELELRTRAFYYYELAQFAVFAGTAGDRKARLIRLRHEFLTRGALDGE